MAQSLCKHYGKPAVLECFGLFFLVLSEEEARVRSPGAGEI